MEIIMKDLTDMIDVWNTEDVLSVRPDLTVEQANKVLEYYINRDKSNDFEIISYIADDLYPETEENL